MRYVPTGIPTSDLHIVWDKAWPLLKKAIDRYPDTPNRLDEGMVLKALMRKQMQLWLTWDVDENRPVGAVVTEIMAHEKFPGKVFLSGSLLGGEKFRDWIDDLWSVIKAWGIESGCTHMYGSGRRGWVRWFGMVECGTAEDTGLPIYVRTLKR